MINSRIARTWVQGKTRPGTTAYLPDVTARTRFAASPNKDALCGCLTRRHDVNAKKRDLIRRRISGAPAPLDVLFLGRPRFGPGASGCHRRPTTRLLLLRQKSFRGAAKRRARNP